MSILTAGSHEDANSLMKLNKTNKIDSENWTDNYFILSEEVIMEIKLVELIRLGFVIKTEKLVSVTAIRDL